MRFFKLVSISFSVLYIQTYTQNNSSVSTINDSATQSTQKLKSDLQFQNFFKNDLKKSLNENLLLGLNLSSKALNDSALVFQSYKLNLNEYSEEELEDFKKSFQMLLGLEKAERIKYDLGVVGKYLGISRNIMTIILAIISVAKYR